MTADFPDRLDLIREFGVPYSQIITNGTLLTERSINKVLDAEITRFTFSIDGGRKETYEQIRVGARFESVIRNIRLFQVMRKERGSLLPQLRINHVLTKWNIDRFDEFLELLDSIQPEALNVRTVEPMTYEGGGESTDPAFFEKVRAIRPKLAAYIEQNRIEDAGFLRDRPTVIELFNESGEKMTCRRPWDTLAIHANGDVHPCMSWTRAPVGNLARQTFPEIWNGKEVAALRREFNDAKPGVDCQHCAIKKNVEREKYDDFFFRMVIKPFNAS